jgi:hypothetical protein
MLSPAFLSAGPCWFLLSHCLGNFSCGYCPFRSDSTDLYHSHVVPVARCNYHGLFVHSFHVACRPLDRTPTDYQFISFVGSLFTWPHVDCSIDCHGLLMLVVILVLPVKLASQFVPVVAIWWLPLSRLGNLCCR